MGTIVPDMGTQAEHKDISAALFGKTRRAVLALLFTNPERSFYVREIIRELGLGRGTVQRELENLTEAGLLVRSVEGNQVHFEANQASPVFPEIKMMMLKTTGVADVIRASLEKQSGRVAVSFLYGSSAAGKLKAESDIDLLVIGDISFKEVVKALADAQETLGREVNPNVFTRSEFRKKSRSGQHFVRSLLDGPKVFLIGGDNELERLAS